MSLQHRVALFKSKFPAAHIIMYKLLKLYHLEGINNKKVRYTKILSARFHDRIRNDIWELNEDLSSAILKGFRFVMLDECTVTKNTIVTKFLSYGKRQLSYHSGVGKISVI